MPARENRYPAELRCRREWCGLVGASRGVARPSVCLSGTADHDVGQRRAFGRCTEDRDRRVTGQPLRRCGVDPGIGLPHRDVDDDVRIELGDDVDDPGPVARVDAVEHRRAQAPSGRIDVDTLERADPRLVLQQ